MSDQSTSIVTPTDQPIDQPIDQPTDQLTDQANHQPTDQANHQPTTNTLTTNDDDTLKLLASRYWHNVEEQWHSIYSLLITGNTEILKLLNNFLPDQFASHVEIEYTFGEINRLPLESFAHHIEIYISPKLNKDNIRYMKILYAARVTLLNASVACYKAYHPNDNITSEIIYKADQNSPDEFSVLYKDFGYQGVFGYDEKKQLLLNLIILVKQKVAEFILKKETVHFMNETKTSREVWMPTEHNPLYKILIDIIGEYNLINHIGYIEFVPSDELNQGPISDPPPTANPDQKALDSRTGIDLEQIPKSAFVELIELENIMQLINKSRKYKFCNYCLHHELQTKLYACTRCKTLYYCSKQCQKADWPNHKQICKI